jgi:ABC-type multidrug transport system fused ATPase/permease subunit
MSRDEHDELPAAALIQEDVRGSGRLSGGFLVTLFRRIPSWRWWLLLLVILTALETVFSVVFRYAIAMWSDPCVAGSSPSTVCRVLEAWQWPLQQWGPGSLGGLGLVLGVLVMGVVARGTSWAVTLVVLSRLALNLHERAVAALSKTQVTYFDAQPSGRLLGRLSDDYEKVAREIPNYLSDILSGTLELIWAVVVVVIGAPYLLPVAAPCAYSYFRLQKSYILVSREMQRLTKVLEAPSLALFAECLGADAAQLIRVHGKTHEFRAEHERRQQLVGRATMVSSRATRWLNMRLKLNAEVFALAVALFVVGALATDSLNVAFCGFLMSLSLGLDGTMQWVTRAVSLLEPSLVSVERVSMLADLPDEESGRQVPISSWDPALLAHGAPWHLALENVSASYRADLPEVLHDLSLNIPAGQRLGIIGRTGAGKSTLFQLLYRMVYVNSGRLLLRSSSIQRGGMGEVDLLQLPVSQARSFFTIVPQNPVLFSGTLRHNLDPLGFWRDADLWEVLEKVGLATTVAALPGALSSLVSEGGSNLSQGERQLLCIARAALNPPPQGIRGPGMPHALGHGLHADSFTPSLPRFVLLDEATASVDHHTDARVGAALDAVFGECTLLIIAHRLETVRSCDRVIAFSEGRVMLEGAPGDVLAKVRFEAKSSLEARGSSGEPSDDAVLDWL